MEHPLFRSFIFPAEIFLKCVKNEKKKICRPHNELVVVSCIKIQNAIYAKTVKMRKKRNLPADHPADHRHLDLLAFLPRPTFCVWASAGTNSCFLSKTH